MWTIKDVLGHITSWEETCLEPLRRFADGGPYDVQVIKDYLAWNDVEAARKRDVPLDVILDELATARQELVEAPLLRHRRPAGCRSDSGSSACTAIVVGALRVGRRRDDSGHARGAPRA